MLSLSPPKSILKIAGPNYPWLSSYYGSHSCHHIEHLALKNRFSVQHVDHDSTTHSINQWVSAMESNELLCEWNISLKIIHKSEIVGGVIFHLSFHAEKPHWYCGHGNRAQSEIHKWIWILYEILQSDHEKSNRLFHQSRHSGGTPSKWFLNGKENEHFPIFFWKS